MKTSHTDCRRCSIIQLSILLIWSISLTPALGQSGDLIAAGLPRMLPPGMLLADRVLIATSDNWEYLDNGLAPRALWYQTTSDDDRWKLGASPFGYGGDGERTTVGYGSNPASKAITCYFRRAFVVTDTTGYRSLQLRLRRDDGAIIYLNGSELLRSNMPAGNVTAQTPALTYVEWEAEDDYLVYHIDLSRLVIGTNRIAAEIHQNSQLSTDLAFDLTLTMREAYEPSTPLSRGSIVTCDPASSNTIGCFTSIVPADPTEQLRLPHATHTFQRLVKSDRDRYSGTNTLVPNGNDFTCYVPENGSSVRGKLSINHENTPGGVSLAQMRFETADALWRIESLNAIDFSSVVRTERNCSGGLTPWGTIITSEETYSLGDENADGYEDIGWQVEIDPRTGKVRDYNGDGRPDKLWALGRLVHENIAFGADGRTIYQGEDGGTGCIYKFVAARSARLDSGTLYVLHRDSDTSTTGTWIQVPNSTASERNNTSTIAAAIGGSFIGSIEDVEVGPDGKVYFASKNVGEIGRFRDNGTTVSEIEAWVSNLVYPLATDTGIASERWGRGNDNLAFDGEGNLWVLQDGGRYHIWVVRPDHTNATPHIDLFATSPFGGEPTGITFSPDYRFLFMSFQNPSTANSTGQRDAADSVVIFDASTTIVIARKEFLGRDAVAPVVDLGMEILRCEAEGPLELKYVNPDAFHIWSDGSTDSVLRVTRDGVYSITVTGNNGQISRDSVTVRFHASTPVDLGPDRVLCPGTTFTFSVPQGLTYLWEDGSSSAVRTVDRAGTYHVRMLDANACPSYDTVTISYATAPRPQLGDDRVICDGESVDLDAGSGFATYLWSDGSTSPSLTVSVSGSYWVFVTTEGGCSGADTLSIDVRDPVRIDLGRDTLICPTCSILLDAGEGFDSYLWSTGATTRTITVSDSGTYVVHAIDTNGCVAVDSISVAVDAVTGTGDLVSNSRFSLRAWPNPFSSEITIGITMKRRASVRLEVYDPAGRHVTTLIDGPLDGGAHILRFDAKRFGSNEGLYMLRVTVDGTTSNHTLVRK